MSSSSIGWNFAPPAFAATDPRLFSAARICSISRRTLSVFNSALTGILIVMLIPSCSDVFNCAVTTKTGDEQGQHELSRTRRKTEEGFLPWFHDARSPGNTPT